MARKTPVEKLNAAIAKVLSDYADEVEKNFGPVTRQLGQKGVTALRNASRETFPGGTGKYANGWKAAYDDARMGATVTIYNADQPGLAHLLENGHLMRNGKRWPGRPHIGPVEERLIEQFTREVLDKL